VAFATFCGLDSISRVITDTRAPRDMVDPVRERGIRVDMVRP
jgi:DeoR/GlpR family transcriptional regulator of sugar metabolism